MIAAALAQSRVLRKDDAMYALKFVLVLGGSVIALASTPASATPAEAAETAISPLKIPGQAKAIPLNFREVMKLHRVPGLSVAVIDNFKLQWVKGYGTAVPEKNVSINGDTVFLAGSVSKSVTAVGMMTMVQRGALSLDEDVNSRLTSWKVPENQYTVKEKVTLRRIASHTAGLSVYGFGGYEVGRPVPTVVQLLDGMPPANSAPVRVVTEPGSVYAYSGGGTTIEQLVLSDVSHQSFPDFMKEALLLKVRMDNSSFDQPSFSAPSKKRAQGADGEGKLIKGGWHIYPEMAAAGLWTTPTDLSKLAVEVARAMNGATDAIISPSIAREMLSPQPKADGAMIGFFAEPSNPTVFVNNGSDAGFQTMFRMDYDTGQGAVLMANSENGFLLMSEYMRALAKAGHWKSAPKARSLAQTLVLTAKLQGIDATLRAFDASKSAPDEKDRPTEQVLAMVGGRMVAAGNISAGLKALERNVAEYPHSANALVEFGNAEREAKNENAAVKAFKKALQIDPSNEDAKKALFESRG